MRSPRLRSPKLRSTRGVPFCLIRRHTPFSPYAAPRFSHMSEMNSLFSFVFRFRFRGVSRKSSAMDSKRSGGGPRWMGPGGGGPVGGSPGGGGLGVLRSVASPCHVPAPIRARGSAQPAVPKAAAELMGGVTGGPWGGPWGGCSGWGCIGGECSGWGCSGAQGACWRRWPSAPRGCVRARATDALVEQTPASARRQWLGSLDADGRGGRRRGARVDACAGISVRWGDAVYAAQGWGDAVSRRGSLSGR